MILGIASGKGGTGKTTIAVNLAKVMAGAVQLVDCDVEEPNDSLFLKCGLRRSETVTIPIPEVEESRCNGCGDCSRFCRFNAIIVLGTKPLVFPELCHSCGGCALVCPTRAIHDTPRRIGLLNTYEANQITLVEGRLDVGIASATPLVRALKKSLSPGMPTILDAPPGTSCSVIATLRGTDYVVLVTEPTPFGLNDLKLAVEMVRELGLPFGVVVNRMGIGDDRVHLFCEQEHIPILLEIPNDRRIAEAYSRGKLIVEAFPEYRHPFEHLWESVLDCKTIDTNHSEFVSGHAVTADTPAY